MYKKILSFVLAFLMAVTVLAGCGKNSSDTDVEATADTEESARIAMTLSLWLPSDYFTEEAEKEVSEAINSLTKAKYDTAIELKLIPRAEYRDAVEARLQEITDQIARRKPNYS